MLTERMCCLCWRLYRKLNIKGWWNKMGLWFRNSVERFIEFHVLLETRISISMSISTTDSRPHGFVFCFSFNFLSHNRIKVRQKIVWRAHSGHWHIQSNDQIWQTDWLVSDDPWQSVTNSNTGQMFTFSVTFI